MLTNRTAVLIFGMLGVLLIGRVVFLNLHNQSQDSGKIEGRVSSIPHIQNNKLVFSVGKTLVISPNLKVSYQDQVAVVGERSSYKITASSVQIIPESGFWKNLKDLRLNLNKKIEQNFPTPQSALLSGILLGIKANLPKDFNQALINTGTIHVVVVSGYNISLLGSFFLVFAPVFGRKKSTLLALLAIIGYSLLVGASAPTLRSVIMGMVSFSAILLGRRTLALYNLLLAAYLMIIINPETLLDVSFQLTFAATLGIILFNKFFENLLKNVPRFFSQALASTLAAQVLVAPLLFYYFGNISLISPLVNALVLWTVPLITILGFAFLVFINLSQLIAALISEILLLPLSLFCYLVNFFSDNFKFFILGFAKSNLISTAGYYFLVFGLSLKLLTERRSKTKN